MTLFLFAHGAGAPSASRWMQAHKRRLEALGSVVTFDYPYMKAGSKRPDPHAKLVAAHREALTAAREAHANPLIQGALTQGPPTPWCSSEKAWAGASAATWR